MEPLLETIGFGPDTDLERVRAALRRPGGGVYGGDRGPFARRAALAGGVEVLSTYDGIGLWPVFRRGVRLDGRLVEFEPEPWGPFPLRARFDVRGPDGPRRLSALAWSARRESWRASGRSTITPSTFALDVAHCGPLLNSGPPNAVRALNRNDALVAAGSRAGSLRGPRWIEPDPTGDLPGTVYLAAPVRRVQTFDNPLTGSAFQLVELDLLGGLSTFVSPWQLKVEGFDPPRPGDWLAGSFVLVVERLRVGGVGG